jgi:predicted RNA-binding Zn-ribbon protein involved in translation (DUF1610 family)
MIHTLIWDSSFLLPFGFLWLFARSLRFCARRRFYRRLGHRRVKLKPPPAAYERRKVYECPKCGGIRVTKTKSPNEYVVQFSLQCRDCGWFKTAIYADSYQPEETYFIRESTFMVNERSARERLLMTDWEDRLRVHNQPLDKPKKPATLTSSGLNR